MLQQIRNAADREVFEHVCVNEMKRFVSSLSNDDLDTIAHKMFACRADNIKNALMGVSNEK